MITSVSRLVLSSWKLTFPHRPLQVFPRRRAKGAAHLMIIQLGHDNSEEEKHFYGLKNMDGSTEVVGFQLCSKDLEAEAITYGECIGQTPSRWPWRPAGSHACAGWLGHGLSPVLLYQRLPEACSPWGASRSTRGDLTPRSALKPLLSSCLPAFQRPSAIKPIVSGAWGSSEGKRAGVRKRRGAGNCDVCVYGSRSVISRIKCRKQRFRLGVVSGLWFREVEERDSGKWVTEKIGRGRWYRAWLGV